MKITLATCFCSAALAFAAFGQDPTITPAPAAPSTPAVVPAPSVAPTVAAAVPTASPSLEQSLEEQIEKKVKRGLNITFGDDDDKDEAKAESRREKRRDSRHFNRDSDNDDSWLAIPIVGIIFLFIFATPVMIVGLIMYFSMSKSRAMHRTVRMMVEKGQEVPAALLNPPPAVRQRSDMRRGVVLVMIGVGLMIFFGATSDWDGGAWALGIIPFLIGCGYLLVWKLEEAKAVTDNLPPAS